MARFRLQFGASGAMSVDELLMPTPNSSCWRWCPPRCTAGCAAASWCRRFPGPLRRLGQDIVLVAGGFRRPCRSSPAEKPLNLAIVVDCQADLAQVALTLHPACRLAGGLYRRKQHCQQRAEDDDQHQHGLPTATRAAARRGLRPDVGGLFARAQCGTVRFDVKVRHLPAPLRLCLPISILNSRPPSNQ